MSMLEVIIGVMLVMIVFLGIAQLMLVGVRATGRTRLATSTVTLAQQGIESVQSLSFDSIVTPASPEYLDQFGNAADPVNKTHYVATDPSVRFIRTMAVSSIGAKEKEISVTVQASRSVYGRVADSTSFVTRRLKFD